MSSDDEFPPEYYGPELMSASWVNMWLRCPRQWGYAKIMGMRSPPGWAMVGGTAMDHTLNEHHRQRILGQNGLRGTALTDYYVQELRAVAEKTAPQGERDPDLEMDGVRLLPIYENGVSKMIEPVEVQKEVRAVIEGTPFVMHLDLVRRSPSGNLVVSDHKFTGKSPPADRAEKSLQLRAYDLALDDPGHGVELIHLVRLKREPKVVVQHHIVRPEQRQEFLQTVRWASLQAATRIYPQTDAGNWVCSPNWCGFWSSCRGRKEGPLPITGEVR